jgi:hypothetical protein
MMRIAYGSSCSVLSRLVFGLPEGYVLNDGGLDDMSGFRNPPLKIYGVTLASPNLDASSSRFASKSTSNQP